MNWSSINSSTSCFEHQENTYTQLPPHYSLVAQAAILVAVGLVGPVSPGVHHGPTALLLQHQSVIAQLDADISHLAPVLTPRVAHDPVLLSANIAPANHADHVVDPLAGLRHNASSVLQKGLCINATGDGATVEDLLLHRFRSTDGTVVGDGDVGVLLKTNTLSGRREGGARARNVEL